MSFGTIACQISLLRLSGFHFRYSTPLSMARRSQLLQISRASGHFQVTASSLEIGLGPGSPDKFSRETFSLMRASKNTRIPASLRCFSDRSLSDFVHEICPPYLAFCWDYLRGNGCTGIHTDIVRQRDAVRVRDLQSDVSVHDPLV